MPKEQIELCMYLLTVTILMCHLAFSFSCNPYFRTFLKALRPAFEKQLCYRVRRTMSGAFLDEVYEEAVHVATESLANQPGLQTLGTDGHKDGRGRTLETITKAKLGVSTFAGCEYMLTERATGAHLAGVLKVYMLASVHLWIAVVADNTGNNVTAFETLASIAALAHLFYLGCFIHVFDLLLEDIAKLCPLAELAKDAHFVITFIKRHSIVYEEFLIAKKQLGIRSDLHLYPQTRFAYLYLMLLSLFKTFAAVRVVLDSPVYRMCKDHTRRRGGKEGKHALAKFNLFEQIIETRTFKLRLEVGPMLLQPLSMALHYLEGDSVPMSHIVPIFQAAFVFAQSLEDDLTISQLLEPSDCERIVELVQERWHGTSRKKGLHADVHALAFVLDAQAQAAGTLRTEPTSDLLNSAILHSAREAMRHHIREPEQRALLAQQLILWLAARPALPPSGAGTSSTKPEAVAQGRNAFSSLYLAQMNLIWDKGDAREVKIAKGEVKRSIPDSDTLGYDLVELIARLKLCGKPTTFWLSMMAEQPMGAKREELEAHKFFCRTAVNVSSIVGHTCGVERAGKAYGLVMTAHRKSMHPEVAKKAIYCLNNYGLLKRDIDMGDAVNDFAGSMLVDETVADDLRAKRMHALRRGKMITDEELLQGEESEEGEEAEELAEQADGDNEEAAGLDPTTREVKWASLPEGLKVASAPLLLDDSLVGKLVFIRWEPPFGWSLGTILDKITNSTPRLFKKFNYRVKYADGAKGPANLPLDNYAHGESAAYNSWCLLERDEVTD